MQGITIIYNRRGGAREEMNISHVEWLQTVEVQPYHVFCQNFYKYKKLFLHSVNFAKIQITLQKRFDRSFCSFVCHPNNFPGSERTTSLITYDSLDDYYPLYITFQFEILCISFLMFFTCKLKMTQRLEEYFDGLYLS